jgi:TolA-binding protein
MKRARTAWVALLPAAALLIGARPAVKSPAAGRDSAVEQRQIARASEALAQGHVDEARALFDDIVPGRVPKENEDDYAYLKAMMVEDGNGHVAALESYLRTFPDGRFRRQATLALGSARYVRGEYAEAENVLSVFSPGVEKDFIGRRALVQRGLAQLARGDAAGALQFLRSAHAELTGSPQEESYYFAVAQAAIRSSKPAEAIEALRRLLERNAKGDYAPQALYAMALCLETVGRTGDAAGVFRQVMIRYPHSYEATRARDRGVRVGAAPATPFPIGGGFAVQVGAFSRRDLADALARDLKLAGVGDVAVRQGSEIPPVYRVRAGAFASREEARALGERLRRERGFSYTIVPR